MIRFGLISIFRHWICVFVFEPTFTISFDLKCRLRNLIFIVDFFRSRLDPELAGGARAHQERVYRPLLQVRDVAFCFLLFHYFFLFLFLFLRVSSVYLPLLQVRDVSLSFLFIFFSSFHFFSFSFFTVCLCYK